MSLLSEQMEKCVIVDKTTVPDGYGGVKTNWVDGAEIQAAVSFDTSMESRIGDAQGVTSRYTIVTQKSVVLRYHDVIKRLRDNKVFRITSDGDDKFTPNSASLNMRVTTAEEWEIPNG